MIVRDLSRKALFVALAFTLALPLSAWAYNKSWDQGHQCINPLWGLFGWGRFDYNGWFHGGYSSKECCELLCKICPVYANTGRLHQAYTDLSVPGVGPSLRIVRTYQSQEWASSLLGRGWLFNLGKRLIVVRTQAGDRIIGIQQETGEQNFFKEKADGTLELMAEYGVTYTLTKDPDGTYVIVQKNGTVQHINGDGKLLEIIDKNGNQLSFEYNAVGCLSRITNASGNYVDFVLGPNGKIASISDNLGRAVQYAYDTNGNLVSSTDPMGHATQYTYDSQNRLISVIDPRGNTVLAVTYDSFQPPRVSTLTEKGQTWTITYNAGYTVKRDSSGHTWTYYFNSLGIIEKVVDPLGHTTQQQHNRVTSTSLEWEQDANGNRITYTYDADGNITSKTDPLGNTWQYTYVSGTNRIETETNPFGVVTKYEYDANGNRTKVVRDFGGPLENTALYTYDAKGNQISATDPLGNRTTYEYDASGNLTKTTDALGNATTYTYDSQGNRLTETNVLGATSTYTYDLMGRLLTLTDALGGKTTYAYDQNGNRVSETNAKGNTTNYTYDPWNRLTRVTDPLGNSTAYSYDSSDNRTGQTDGNGHATNYTYDLAHRLVRETNALGGQTNYTYDAAGNVLTITDAAGNARSFTYDAKNQRQSETNALGERTNYTCDAVGNLLTATQPNGNTIGLTYDRLGRLIATSDSLGPVATYTYDLAGRQLAVTNALGCTMTRVYDVVGRTVRIIDPVSNSTTYAYDAAGRLLRATDREGSATNYAYDALDREISQTDSVGGTTTCTYDGLGNLVSITDARGNATSYAYDAANRLVTETYANGTTRAYTYDPVGNIASRTDQKGQVTAYVYDALDRRTKIDYPGSNDREYTFDSVGNLLTANNLNATISFTYDRSYRPTQSVQSGRTAAYSYNTASNSKTTTYPSGKVVKAISNARGLLSRVEDVAGQPFVQYTYDAADRVQTKTYLNGVIGNFTRNSMGWIAQLGYDKSGSEILGFQHGFDREGNRLYASTLHDTGSSEQYIYDAKHRLTQFRRGTLDAAGHVVVPVTQTSYNLDALANWTSKTTDGATQNRTHDNMNELVSIDGSPLTYDDNGNLIDDGINAYEYDYDNRLLKVSRKSDSVVLGEYKYDAIGNRCERSVGGVATTYFHDGGHVIEEYVGGSLSAAYVYGRAIDEVLSMERGGHVYYYHTDSLGSVIALTDASGIVAERYSYSAYGEPSPVASALGNVYRFTGRALDAESGIYYYRSRYYGPQWGRFLQRDFAYVDGLNLYEYTRSNPINNFDPTGAVTGSFTDGESRGGSYAADGARGWVTSSYSLSCNCTSDGCRIVCAFNVQAPMTIVPDSDPIWQDASWDSRYGNTTGTLQSRVANVRSHERDHQQTTEAFYNYNRGQLVAEEQKTFATSQECTNRASQIAPQVSTNWTNAMNHSGTFDTAPWWTGNQYAGHPLTNQTWLP